MARRHAPGRAAYGDFSLSLGVRTVQRRGVGPPALMFRELTATLLAIDWCINELLRTCSIRILSPGPRRGRGRPKIGFERVLWIIGRMRI